MNKVIIKLVAVSALASAVMACGGGSSSPGGAPIPSKVTASVAPALPGTSPSPGTSVGTVSGEPGNYTISVQGGNGQISSYPGLAIPSAPTNIQYTGNNVVVTTGSPTSPTVYIVSTTSSGSSVSLQSNPLVSISFNNISNAIVSPENFVPAVGGVLYTGTNDSDSGSGVLFSGVPTTSGANATSVTSYASSCSSSASAVTALSATTSTLSVYNAAYIGSGDNIGNICVYNVSSSQWFNVTSSARTIYTTTHGAVNGITFATLSSKNYGYWYNNDGTIWGIVAPAGVTSCTSSTCSINQLNGSAYSGAPRGNINSIIVDSSNNLFVGTTQGVVYSLQNGFTSWTYIQLSSNTGLSDTGAVVLSFATNGSVIATTPTAQYNIGF